MQINIYIYIKKEIKLDKDSTVYHIFFSAILIGRRFGSKNAFKTPGGLGCCPFEGGGSVVVDLLFIVAPIVVVVIVICFVVRYCMSILVLQSSLWGRESWLRFLVCLLCVS